MNSLKLANKTQYQATLAKISVLSVMKLGKCIGKNFMRNRRRKWGIDIVYMCEIVK